MKPQLVSPPTNVVLFQCPSRSDPPEGQTAERSEGGTGLVDKDEAAWFQLTLSAPP